MTVSLLSCTSSIPIVGWNGFIWLSARQDFWISCAKNKFSGRICGVYIVIALKERNFSFLCTYKNDVAVRVLTVTSPEDLVAWAQCQPCQHSCGALKDCCEKTENSCLSFVHVPLSLGSYPWSLSWTMLPIHLHPALHPPWFCRRSSWIQVPGLIWTCRRATMRRPKRLIVATVTSSDGHLLWLSYLGPAQPEPLPVLPSRLSTSPLVSAKMRQWTDLRHSKWSDWLNSYPA